MDSFRSQSQSDSQPLFYSPALPSELLWYIIHHCSYPTTLIVCSSRLEFLAALARDVKQSQQVDEKSQEQQEQQQDHGEQETSPQPDQYIPTDTKQHRKEAQESRQFPRPSQLQQAEKAQSTQDEPTKTTSTTTPTKITPGPWASQLLASPLYQIAVARHIRTVFIPTVSHLRAFLSVFETNTSTSNKVPAPPSPPPPPPYEESLPNQQTHPRPQPQQLLLVNGFLALHRDSSEWSVQGLNNSVAVLLEAGRRVGLGVVVVEPVEYDESLRGMDDLLGEKMPVVSGSALRGAGDHLERSVGGGLIGKTVDVRRVLGRWFRFGVGEWERERERDRLGI